MGACSQVVSKIKTIVSKSETTFRETHIPLVLMAGQSLRLTTLFLEYCIVVKYRQTLKKHARIIYDCRCQIFKVSRENDIINDIPVYERGSAAYEISHRGALVRYTHQESVYEYNPYYS